MPGYGGGIGGDNDPGNEAGAGRDNGGAGQGGEGGVQGGRGVNPGRGYEGPEPQPGGRGRDEGWDTPNARGELAGRYGLNPQHVTLETLPNGRLGVRVKGASLPAMREQAVKDLPGWAQGIAKAAIGGRIGLVSGAVMRGLDEHYGQVFDAETGQPHAEYGEGGSEGLVNRLEREAAKRREGKGEDEEEGGKTPQETDAEHRARLRADAEEVIGGMMPDGGFEVPDWSVIIAQDADPLNDAAMTPPGVSPDMGPTLLHATERMLMRSLFEED